MKRKMTSKALACLFFAAALIFATASCEVTAEGSSTVASIVVGTYPTDTAAAETTAMTAETVASVADATDATLEQTALEAPPVYTEETYAFINPLTGESVPLDAEGVRPIAVVVDNASGALAHQSGLSGADVLYETLTAPGITRFLAIYSDYRSMPTVCNVRAGRVYDVIAAKNFNAVLIAHGGLSSPDAKYDFYSATASVYGSENAYIDTSKDPAWAASNASVLGTTVYYGDNYRTDLKYDTVVTKAAIDYSLINSGFASEGHGIGGGASNPFKLSDEAPDGDSAASVTLSFTATGVSSSLVKNVTFRYGAETGTYLRFEDSRPHVDAASGKQLEFKNVVVLMTDVSYIAGESDVDPLTTDVAVYGSGSGYYFCRGKYVPLVWINTAETGLKLYTSAGELELMRGNTYVGYVSRANPAAVKITPGK